eukprot:scaffold198562_cov47-Attheya_sp.AAC.3
MIRRRRKGQDPPEIPCGSVFLLHQYPPTGVADHRLTACGHHFVYLVTLDETICYGKSTPPSVEIFHPWLHDHHR